MRIPALRRHRSADLPGVSGVVRLDHRTKNLTKRLKPGDIAIIDHLDLDRVSAEALVDCQVAAVVNVRPSVSGRYPNLGPDIVVDAGIPLVDDAGTGVFSAVREGEMLRVDGHTVYRDTDDGSTVIARGTLQTTETVAALM
ncbi:MAG: putative cytokinetic ring protein SteA, partial [Jiangellaceae bacterium]